MKCDTKITIKMVKTEVSERVYTLSAREADILFVLLGETNIGEVKRMIRNHNVEVNSDEIMNLWSAWRQTLSPEEAKLYRFPEE